MVNFYVKYYPDHEVKGPFLRYDSTVGVMEPELISYGVDPSEKYVVEISVTDGTVYGMPFIEDASLCEDFLVGPYRLGTDDAIMVIEKCK